MKQNFIILIDGAIGAGKSTIGNLLHKKLKRTVVINTDSIKWFISDYKRGSKDNDINNDVLARMCDEYLKNKLNLVIPQGFWGDRSYINPFIKLSKKHHAKLLIYHLDAPKEILHRRVGERKYQNVSPPSKSRVTGNIQKWKSKRMFIGKEFTTHTTSPESIVKEILIDLK